MRSGEYRRHAVDLPGSFKLTERSQCSVLRKDYPNVSCFINGPWFVRAPPKYGDAHNLLRSGLN